MAAPSFFERSLLDLHGETGAAWLNALPDLIAACAARWDLRVSGPFPNLTYNYAAPAIRNNGVPAVLKLGVPGGQELSNEMEALRLYDGRGIARLLEAAPDVGAMLLERLQPGRMLSTVADDEEATRIAARVMRQLWLPAPAEHAFATVAGWAGGLGRLRAMFGGDTGPLPSALVDKAEQYFAELLAEEAAPVLLHGDLHHYNILSAEREPWLAIDPKGLVGPAGYEVGPLLHNPTPAYLDVPAPGRKLARRVAILSEMLGLDRQRVAKWGVAVAVLAAWWSVEDHGEVWEEVLVCARLLEEMAG